MPLRIFINPQENIPITWERCYFRHAGESTRQNNTSGQHDVVLVFVAENTLFTAYGYYQLSKEHAAYEAAKKAYPDGVDPSDSSPAAAQAAAAFAAMPRGKRMRGQLLRIFSKAYRNGHFSTKAAALAACRQVQEDYCSYLTDKKVLHNPEDLIFEFVELYLLVFLPVDGHVVLKCYPYPVVLTCKGQLACWRVPLDLMLDLGTAKAEGNLPNLEANFNMEELNKIKLGRRPDTQLFFCSTVRPGSKGMIGQLQQLIDGELMQPMEPGEPATNSSFRVQVMSVDPNMVVPMMLLPTHLDPGGSVFRVSNLLQQDATQDLRVSGGNIFFGRSPLQLAPATRTAIIDHVDGPGMHNLENPTDPKKRPGLFRFQEDYERTSDIMHIKDKGISSAVCSPNPGSPAEISPLIHKIYDGAVSDIKNINWEPPTITAENSNQQEWILDVAAQHKVQAENICNLCSRADSIRAIWKGFSDEQKAEVQAVHGPGQDVDDLISRLSWPNFVDGAEVVQLSNPPAGFIDWLQRFQDAVVELSVLLSLPLPAAPGGEQAADAAAAAVPAAQQAVVGNEQAAPQQDAQQVVVGDGHAVGGVGGEQAQQQEQQQREPQQLAAQHDAVAPPVRVSLAAAGSGSSGSGTMVGMTRAVPAHSRQLTPIAALAAAFAATPGTTAAAASAGHLAAAAAVAAGVGAMIGKAMGRNAAGAVGGGVGPPSRLDAGGSAAAAGTAAAAAPPAVAAGAIGPSAQTAASASASTAFGSSWRDSIAHAVEQTGSVRAPATSNPSLLSPVASGPGSSAAAAALGPSSSVAAAPAAAGPSSSVAAAAAAAAAGPSRHHQQQQAAMDTSDDPFEYHLAADDVEMIDASPTGSSKQQVSVRSEPPGAAMELGTVAMEGGTVAGSGSGVAAAAGTVHPRSPSEQNSPPSLPPRRRRRTDLEQTIAAAAAAAGASSAIAAAAAVGDGGAGAGASSITSLALGVGAGIVVSRAARTTLPAATVAATAYTAAVAAAAPALAAASAALPPVQLLHSTSFLSLGRDFINDTFGKTAQQDHAINLDAADQHGNFQRMVGISDKFGGVIHRVQADGRLKIWFLNQNGSIQEREWFMRVNPKEPGKDHTWGVLMLMDESGSDPIRDHWGDAEYIKQRFATLLTPARISAADYEFDYGAPAAVLMSRYRTTVTGKTNDKRLIRTSSSTRNDGGGPCSSSEDARLEAFRLAAFRVSVVMVLLWHAQTREMHPSLQALAAEHKLQPPVQQPQTETSMFRGDVMKGLVAAALAQSDNKQQGDHGSDVAETGSAIRSETSSRAGGTSQRTQETRKERNKKGNGA